MVFVHRVDSYQGKSVSRQKRDVLLKMIIQARMNSGHTDPVLIEPDKNRVRPNTVLLRPDQIKHYCAEYKNWGGERYRIVFGPGGMWMLSAYTGNFRLIPESAHGFKIADLDLLLIFKENAGGRVTGFEIQHEQGRHEFFYPAKKSFLPGFRDIILKSGISQIEKKYQKLKSEAGDIYDFSETELNRLGYELLRADRISDAIRIFELNVSEFPDSYNPHDSLGEACLKAGETGKALTHYQKAARLNPRQNTLQKKQYQKQLTIIKKLSEKK
jgi:hypothetical protein